MPSFPAMARTPTVFSGFEWILSEQTIEAASFCEHTAHGKNDDVSMGWLVGGRKQVCVGKTCFLLPTNHPMLKKRFFPRSLLK